jgi:hypothetical protein
MRREFAGEGAITASSEYLSLPGAVLAGAVGGGTVMSGTAATTPKSGILPEELMNSVLGKLYDTLRSGDRDFLEDRRSFFAWATPGLPLTEDQFDFMSGFLPQVETVEKREAEASRRFALAADFSRLVDFLPDPRLFSTTSIRLQGTGRERPGRLAFNWKGAVIPNPGASIERQSKGSMNRPGDGSVGRVG